MEAYGLCVPYVWLISYGTHKPYASTNFSNATALKFISVVRVRMAGNMNYRRGRGGGWRSDGSAVSAYCDMTLLCGGVTGGWVRVAELDMTNSSHQCPSGMSHRAH